MRYVTLTDEQLRDKAAALGLNNVNLLSRAQIVQQLVLMDPDAKDADAMGKKSDFVTPVVDQGEVPSQADGEEREVHDLDDATTGELTLPEGTEADGGSLGGTGGVTETTTGNRLY